MYALSLKNIVNFARRWTGVKINQIYTDRFGALASALQVLENRLSTIYPTLLTISVLALDITTAQTGLILTGTNFLGSATKSTGASRVGAGKIAWTAIMPGDLTYSVVIQADAEVSSGQAEVDVSDSTITIRHNVASAATVVSAVAADAVAKYLISGSVSAAGNVGNGTSSVTGGSGTPPILTVGSLAVSSPVSGRGITAFTNSSITFDLDATSLAGNKHYAVRLTCDGVFAGEAQLAATINGLGVRAVLVSGTGTGSSQSVAHTLGVTPKIVLVVPRTGSDGSGAAGNNAAAVSYGSHTSSNVVVTVTNGVAWDAFVIG